MRDGPELSEPVPAGDRHAQVDGDRTPPTVSVHDLSHPLEDAWTYPGDPAVTLTDHATHAEDGYRVGRLALGTHAGTHVDAPAHTEADGETLGAFPVDRFHWTARRVDCRDLDAGAEIPPSRVPDDLGDDISLLVLWTGWDRHWGDERYRDHPALSPETARLCAGRGLDVAVDAPNVDPTPPVDETDGDGAGETGGESEDGLAAHHALLGAGRLIVENVTGLERPPDTFALHAVPIAVDADAAPVRAVAVVDGRGR